MVVVFTAATFAFLCLQIAPGDPATALGEGVPADIRARWREIYGYNDPVSTQYLRWLGATLQGDLGWSTSQQRAVTRVLAEAIPNSLLLILPGFAVATVVGLAIGAWQGVHAGRWRDRLTSVALLLLYSMPEFWLALALLLVFTVWWPILPSGGMSDDIATLLPAGQQLVDRLRHLVLPASVVALFDLAVLARLQRTSMADAMMQPFVRTALAGGLSTWRVRLQVWRTALLPVLSVMGYLLPLNLAGAVYVEKIYAWPGLGYTIVNAINKHDYALVAGCVIVGSTFMVLGTSIADLLRELADPRLRQRAHAEADRAGASMITNA